jgi:hypothetical protein
MDAYSYAGVSDSQFETFLRSYRELCSRSWRVYVPLLVAYLGQFVLYSSFLEALVRRPLKPVALFMAGLPLLVYFSITFGRLPPPIRPRTFRRLLFLAISWYVASTFVVVGMGIAGQIPANAAAQGITVVIWLCAFAGWLGIPTLVRYHRLLLSQDHYLESQNKRG